jgi:hypothetical protein
MSSCKDLPTCRYCSRQVGRFLRNDILFVVLLRSPDKLNNARNQRLRLY